MCHSLIDVKLNEFWLSLAADIVCIVTDGASVTVKVGKLVDTEQQLCYAHAVQLAVLDVLYRRREVTPVVSAQLESDATECEDNSDGEAAEADEVVGDQRMEVVDDDYDVLVQMSTEYHNVVQKVRKVVKLFKRLPARNDTLLQPYVKQEFAREISLLLDCKTRWNSLVDMLSHFLQLRGPAQKALIDLGQASLIDDGDFSVLQEMVSCLEPLKLAVTALCRRDTNLMSGEAALNFCLVNLQKQSSELAKTLADVLGTRIQQRRKVHAAVLQYLHSNTARQTATDVFLIPSNDTIRKFIRKLISRLEISPTTSDCTSDSSSSTEETTSSQSQQEAPDEEPSMQQQLEMTMRQSVAPAAQCHSSSSQDADKKLDAAIKTEMSVFNSSGRRGRCLERAYQYLLSIPPTSVEAECAFSTAGVLCTKLRSRLDDRTLDTLCFLRSYYKRD